MSGVKRVGLFPPAGLDPAKMKRAAGEVNTLLATWSVSCLALGSVCVFER